MEQTLVDAFDTICSFSADNSTAGEKWKTNSNYMINRRFIVPYMTDGERWGYSNEYVELRTWGNNTQQIEDVIRALCYITGTPYEKTPHLSTFVNNNNLEWGKWHDMEIVCIENKDECGRVVHTSGYRGFFRIRGYKKGTMHFEFLDEEVWAKFNQAVADIRGWHLPQNVKRKRKKM